MTEHTIAGMLVLMIVAGVAIITLALRNHQRMRELIMRERIAMLEKGLVPPPEIDPGRFDRVERLLQARRQMNRLAASRGRVSRSGQRYRSLGVMTMGFGCAFMVLLTFAGGVPGAGLGIGGALVVLGAAMFINGIMLGQADIDTDEDEIPPGAPVTPPQEPPPNVAP